MLKTPIRICFLFIILLLSLEGISQANFIKGYIVTNINDTISGRIDYRNWNKNPQALHFTSDGGVGKIIRYAPGDIKAAGIELKHTTEIYRSYTVQFDTSFQQMSKLTTNPEEELKTSQVFLLLLADGRMALYKYKGEDGHLHLYFSGDQQYPVGLINHSFINSNQTVQINRFFRSQLIKAFQDCPDLKADAINQLTYTEKQIQKVVSSYNSCMSHHNYSFQRERNPIKFGVVAGMSRTSLSVKGLPSLEADFTSSVAPSFGLSANFLFPRSEGKSSVYSELLLKMHKNENEVIDYVNSENYTAFRNQMEVTYIKLNIMYRHQYARTLLKPFWQIGVSNGLALNIKSTQEQHKVMYSTDERKSLVLNILQRRHEQGIICGGGIMINKRSGLELRVEFSNGMTNVDGINSVCRSAFLLYGFQF